MTSGTKTPRRIAATEARIHFGELVDDVAARGEVLEVDRADGFAVDVAPVDVAELGKRAFDAEAWLANLERLQESIRAHLESNPITESSVDIIRQLRDRG